MSRGRGRRAKPLHLGPRFVAPAPPPKPQPAADPSLPAFTVRFDLPE